MEFRCFIHLRYLVLVGGVLVCCVVLLNSAHKKLFGKFGGLLCVLRRDGAGELRAESSTTSLPSLCHSSSQTISPLLSTTAQSDEL